MRIIPLKFNTNYYPILYGKIKTNNYLLFRCNSLFWMFRKLELTGNLNDYLLRRVRAIKEEYEKGSYEASVSFYGPTLGPLVVGRIVDEATSFQSHLRAKN